MSRDLKFRRGGLIALALAAGVAWWGIWRPLRAAQDGAADVSYSLIGVVFVPVAFIFGLFFLIAGDRFPYRDEERKALTPTGWALFAVAAAAGIATNLWMQSTMEALGYQ